MRSYKNSQTTLPLLGAMVFSLLATSVPTIARISAAAAGEFFDDFNYRSSSDPVLSGAGWSVRTGAGGPGPQGVTWSANNVTFLDDPSNASNRIMQFVSSTAGTGSSTVQTEINSPKKFLQGTYAARVRFRDSPDFGPDGDSIVETFFTISGSNDIPYAEMDFEYLANGGWGATGPTMFMTSWATTTQRASNNVSRSLTGWHKYLIQAVGGQVRYYIDGVLVATHSGANFPDAPMVIAFNLWFTSLRPDRTPRAYRERVDWVYHAKDVVLSQAQVDAVVSGFRSRGVIRLDTVR